MNDETKPQESPELVASGASLDIIERGQYDIQIATAHKYPRSIKRFRDDVLAMATLNEDIARQCNYSLPRKDKSGQVKTIEGASIRFAEIIGSAWGNAHVGTRVINDDGELITAQAVFHDLEKNWKIVEEVERRVTDKNGRRFSPDMVAVTANAARSIAMRNAVLHGIPRPLWEDLAARARSVAAGDARSLASKRLEAVKAFAVYGVTEAQILALLGRAGIEDVTVSDLGTLFGVLTSIKEETITPEEAFATPKPDIQMPQAKPSPAPLPVTGAAAADMDNMLVVTDTGEILSPPKAAPADDVMARPASEAQRKAILNTGTRKNLTPEQIGKIVLEATGFTLETLPMGAVNPALGAIANHGKS
jgi:hypothetical protein